MQKGFTLVETLIILSVFIILIGISTINLLNAKHQSSLSTSVDKFIADLKQQQLKAMVGDTEGSGIISDYGIHFETTSYTLFRNIYSGTSDFVVKLPDTIQISTDLSVPYVLFEKGSGIFSNYETPNPNNKNTITFRDPVDNSQKEITLNQYGVIVKIE